KGGSDEHFVLAVSLPGPGSLAPDSGGVHPLGRFHRDLLDRLPGPVSLVCVCTVSRPRCDVHGDRSCGIAADCRAGILALVANAAGPQVSPQAPGARGNRGVARRSSSRDPGWPVGANADPAAAMRSCRDRRPAGRRPRRGGLLAGSRHGSRSAGPVRAGSGSGTARSRAGPPGRTNQDGRSLWARDGAFTHSHDRRGGLHLRGGSMSAMLFAQVNQPPSSWSSTIFYMLIIAIGLIALMFCIFLAKYFNLWIQAKMTQTNVSIWDLVGMTFRKVNPNIIVRSKIMAYQSGLSEKDGVTTRALEAHYLAGGNVPNVVRALIADKRAAAIDLAGRNVLEAVQTSVNPKVIPCPDPTQGRLTIDGVAKNGIQLKVKAKVTVRTNLDRLVGGATDETIIARVGEGIVNAIGSADTHLMVLEKPDSISKRVLEKGLDAGTAYEILSIDIADIDVGDNVGANLQALQAEADTRVARAKAEERRAFGAAKEQEMLAHVQENRAKVVLAEAEIPMAIAEAFRKGNLGIA